MGVGSLNDDPHPLILIKQKHLFFLGGGMRRIFLLDDVGHPPAASLPLNSYQLSKGILKALLCLTLDILLLLYEDWAFLPIEFFIQKLAASSLFVFFCYFNICEYMLSICNPAWF